MNDHEDRPVEPPSRRDGFQEGEEPPPRGARVASIARWVLVAFMAALAAAAWIRSAASGAGASSEHQAHYQCPMHPAVMQDRGGQCPVCGMDLVSVDRASVGPAAVAGAAANQGADPAAKHGAASGAYWCPMHPEVASDDPNATCSRCGGMKLVPRQRAAPGAARPPGLVGVDIPPERAQLIGLRTARAKRDLIAPRIRSVGFVSVDESAYELVTARYTGWIERVRARRSGERVERGQILAMVYSPELIAAQQSYVAAVRWAGGRTSIAPPAQATLGTDPGKRLELYGIAKRDIDELSRTGAPQNLLPIRAPTSGHLARISATPGLYVQPGAELFQIVDLSSVRIAADLQEPDADRVRVGQEARFRLASRPEAIAGKVAFVYPAVDGETRTVQAVIEISQPEPPLRPGMTGDVVIDLPAVDAVLVPRDAVVETGEHRYVFVAQPAGRFEPRLVRTGADDGERIAILDGVADGEDVVTTANFLVDSESRLRAAIEGFRVPASAGD